MNNLIEQAESLLEQSLDEYLKSDSGTVEVIRWSRARSVAYTCWHLGLISYDQWKDYTDVVQILEGQVTAALDKELSYGS